MFKVLYPPFSDDIDEQYQRAHSILVYRSEKRTKVFCANIARVDDTRASATYRFETTAESLNLSTTYEFTRVMIDAIYYTNRQGEYRRRTAVRPMYARQAPFAPNNDWGQGGTGVDGYW